MTAAPPPLPVRHMSRMDFYGVLFIKFPVEREWTWAQARRELERMIRLTGSTEITPATVWQAFHEERLRRLANFPPAEIEKRVAAAWKERDERNRERMEKNRQAQQKADWSF